MEVKDKRKCSICCEINLVPELKITYYTFLLGYLTFK